ncbi:MAG: cell envelope integrity protein CreD [Siphonobacter sp.]
METTPTFFERFSHWVKQSLSLKLFTIGFLTLILLIPTVLIQNLITERELTRNTAVEEVSSKWGSPQIVAGPVLTIPFKTIITDDKGKTTTRIENAHFLPESLNIMGNILPEKRYRGIYIVMLYNTRLQLSGRFAAPDFEKLKIKPDQILWNEAFLSLGIIDLKGIRQAIFLTFRDQKTEFEPGQATNDLFQSGIGVPVKISAVDRSPSTFSLNLNLNGSTALQFVPLGKETHVQLKSPWSTPSFIGSFLPEKRSITKDGFSVQWNVLQHNRNYPQQGINTFIPVKALESIESENASGAFGLKLLLPIDEYQKTTRSAKYSILFIVLSFMTFFIMEVLGKRRIHPIQYLLVGFAISLFYVLLLSLSEQLPFHIAYLISTAVILTMVSLYARYVVKNLRYTLVFSGILALLYAFFYSLLQLEDYALLLGSIGLCLVLGLVMYLTRHLDWYNTKE